jgi:hypothetical protein
METSSSRRRAPTTRRTITTTFSAVVLAGLLVACGNGGSSNDDDASDSSDHDLSPEEEAVFEAEREFARCMQDHGFEDLPDPEISGNGFMTVGIPLTGPEDSEDWNAAQEACVPAADDDASAETGAETAGWEPIVPGGDCQCSDGSEFNFWVREADPEKVVFYLRTSATPPPSTPPT